MEHTSSRRVGTQPSARHSSVARMRAMLPSWLSRPFVLVTLILGPALAACASTGSTVTATRTLCAPWSPITYSGQGDTAKTKRQVQVHNKTGQNLGCWK